MNIFLNKTPFQVLKNLIKHPELFAYLAVLSFVSCERIIDYPVPSEELLVVVNAVLNTDSVLKINISNSIPVLNTNTAPYISNARVDLFENNTFIGILPYQSEGFYAIEGLKVKAGAEYRTVVTTNEGREAIASCVVPFPVAIGKVDTFYRLQNNNQYYSNYSYDCILTINDPVNVANYYEIKVYRKTVEYIAYDSLGEIIKPFEFFSDDPVFEFYQSGSAVYPMGLTIGDVEESVTSAFFSDHLIDGKKFSVRICLSSWSFEFEGVYYFCLRSLSRDYYIYLKSLSQYYMAEGNPFSERVQVHSNISNGLGIFGGYSSYTDSISIKNRFSY